MLHGGSQGSDALDIVALAMTVNTADVAYSILNKIIAFFLISEEYSNNFKVCCMYGCNVGMIKDIYNKCPLILGIKNNRVDNFE